MGKTVQRILQNSGALAAGNGVQLFTQLLVPPAFILAYSVAGYGEWLALSASVSYLVSLDIGLQAYLINELTILYARNHLNRYRRVNSVGLRIILSIVCIASIAAALVFLVPITRLLRLSMDPFDAGLTLFLLALQVIWNIVFAYFFTLFRVFGKAHRGVMWGNAQRTVLLVCTITLILFKVPFWAIALGQLATLVPATALAIWDFKRVSADAFPTLEYWDRKTAKEIFKPSVYFAIATLNNFLVFQMPVLVLQIFAGTAVVVMFSVTRTLFNTGVQFVRSVQHGLLPEITRVYALTGREGLNKLYRFSEAFAVVGGLVLNCGLAFSSSFLISLWLKGRVSVEPAITMLMCAVMIVATYRESKYIFQYATNCHQQTNLSIFVVYAMMIGAMCVAAPRFGLMGVLWCWFVSELVLSVRIHFLNVQLIGNTISLVPLVKLLLVTPFSLALVWYSSTLISSGPIFGIGAGALVIAAISVVACRIFHITPLMSWVIQNYFRPADRHGIGNAI